MAADSAVIRAALKQQLQTDRLFGLASVPMRPVERAPVARAGAARVTAADTAAKAEQLRILDESKVRGCTLCGLCKIRTQTVFGQGNPAARLVFVGEAPGFQEDRDGLAFVGRAGQLLTRMIVAMGLKRDDVFICNVLKCRPPENRDPSADEILACSPYLHEQLKIIDPEVMVALGAPAAKTLLNTVQSIGRLRGRFHDYYPGGGLDTAQAIPVMPTYHPAYLLRYPEEKAKTWADLQLVMDRLGLPIPSRSRQ